MPAQRESCSIAHDNHLGAFLRDPLQLTRAAPRIPVRVLGVVLALTCACTPSSPTARPTELTIEEHRLSEAPSTDPFAFEPVESSMEAVLAQRAAERSKVIPDGSLLISGNHALRLSLGADVITATEYYQPGAAAGWVAVTRADQEIYRIEAGIPSPLPSLQGLWTYDDHWVLETAYVTTDSVKGRLSLDGALLAPQGAVDEAFDFQLLHGRPFYFFGKRGHIALHYDGREMPSAYDEILHYQCCSASVLNPLHAENLVAFFARRHDTWYYVETGVYGK